MTAMSSVMKMRINRVSMRPMMTMTEWPPEESVEGVGNEEVGWKARCDRRVHVGTAEFGPNSIKSERLLGASAARSYTARHLAASCDLDKVAEHRGTTVILPLENLGMSTGPSRNKIVVPTTSTLSSASSEIYRMHSR